MTRLKQTTGWTLAAALVLALALPSAHAGRGDDRFMAREGQRPERQERAQREAQQERQFQRRDERGGEGARQQRLSPEERRQLRRDVHDAGRDLYRPRR